MENQNMFSDIWTNSKQMWHNMFHDKPDVHGGNYDGTDRRVTQQFFVGPDRRDD